MTENERKLADHIVSLLAESLTGTVDETYLNLQAQAVQIVEPDQAHRSNLERRIVQRWLRVFGAYDLLVATMRSIYINFAKDLPESTEPKTDFQFEALLRIHSRSNLLASEIRSLMASGHASGAFARWRSLHELAVVASFLTAHDQELAEKYMLHETIMTARAADRFEQYAEMLGIHAENPSQREARIQAKRDLVERFGPTFSQEYGWAAGNLKGNASFANIEKSMGLDYWRPNYAMASVSVHASFKALAFDIGVEEFSTSPALSPVGPSERGIYIPARNTALSLFQCTNCLLQQRPSWHMLVVQPLVQRLCDDVLNACAEIESSQDTFRDEPL